MFDFSLKLGFIDRAEHLTAIMEIAEKLRKRNAVFRFFPDTLGEEQIVREFQILNSF